MQMTLDAMEGGGRAWMAEPSKRQRLAEALAWPRGARAARNKAAAEAPSRESAAKAAFFGKLGHKEALSGPAAGESEEERGVRVEGALARLLRRPGDGGSVDAPSDAL